MKNRSFWTLIALLPFALSACGGSSSGGSLPPPAPPTPPTPPSPIEPGMLGDGRLGELVSKVRDRHNIPAMGAIVVSSGVVVESAVDGLRSLNSATPVAVSDKWHIGSVTKAMTATLVAIAVEQSLLTWDTTPLDIWPQDGASMHNAYKNVTLTQLLAHQAGIQPNQHMIPSIAMIEDSAPGTVVEKRRLWAKELLELNPANSAGEYNYANGGYIIVGSMLETVTGLSWEELMQNDIFAPLGMQDSGFRAPGTPGQTDQPWGHWEQNGQLVAIEPGPDADNPQAIGPAGNVHTTLNDYALFMFAHLEGELGVSGLVSADTYKFLHTPVGGHDYALGWQYDGGHSWANGPLLFHTGSNLRWLANAGIIPGLNTGILIVMNAASQDAMDASDEMANLLLNRILQSQ